LLGTFHGAINIDVNFSRQADACPELRSAQTPTLFTHIATVSLTCPKSYHHTHPQRFPAKKDFSIYTCLDVCGNFLLSERIKCSNTISGEEFEQLENGDVDFGSVLITRA